MLTDRIWHNNYLAELLALTQLTIIMEFLRFEDLAGLYDATLFHRTYRRYVSICPLTGNAQGQVCHLMIKLIMLSSCTGFMVACVKSVFVEKRWTYRVSFQWRRQREYKRMEREARTMGSL